MSVALRGSSSKWSKYCKSEEFKPMIMNPCYLYYYIAIICYYFELWFTLRSMLLSWSGQAFVVQPWCLRHSWAEVALLQSIQVRLNFCSTIWLPVKHKALAYMTQYSWSQISVITIWRPFILPWFFHGKGRILEQEQAKATAGSKELTQNFFFWRVLVLSSSWGGGWLLSRRWCSCTADGIMTDWLLKAHRSDFYCLCISGLMDVLI